MEKCSILLIDDEPQILRALGKHFELLGHVVHTAESGKEGIALHARTRPDVTILDQNMPDMSGLQVLEVLRQRGAIVVMLTGKADIETSVQAMKLGAENFLAKPVNMAHLTAAIEKAAEKLVLRREIVHLKERLRPNKKRLALQAVLIALLVLASAVVGRMMAGSDKTRGHRMAIPAPADTSGATSSPDSATQN